MYEILLSLSIDSITLVLSVISLLYHVRAIQYFKSVSDKGWYPYRPSGRGGGWQKDAPILFIRGYRQHCFENGKSWGTRPNTSKSNNFSVSLLDFVVSFMQNCDARIYLVALMCCCCYNLKRLFLSIIIIHFVSKNVFQSAISHGHIYL